MKRKYNLLFLLIILMALFPGCEKFLDEELKGERSDVLFFQTAGDADLALTGIYNCLTFANADNRIWVFGDVASDDAAKGGNPGDQADIDLIDNFNIAADNGNLETVWNIYYEGISRANKLLDNMDGIEMDGERKSQIIGEAKFLRAYYYFWLTNIFGDVPVHLTTPTTPEEMQKTKSVRVNVFNNAIIPDLQDAATRLPASQSLSQAGRPSSFSAIAFLAKSYLLMEDWVNAENAANQVIQQGGYMLMNVYNMNFQLATKDNQESIFTVQHLAGQDPWLGNRLNQWFAARAENGYGFNVPTQSFVDEFEKTAEEVYDPRLDYTVGRAGQPWFNDTVMFDPSWSPTGYMQKKYLQPLDEVPRTLKADGELNFVFLRYADVLLIMAEAQNEQGKTGDAVGYLNLIRKRARECYLYDENLPGYGTIPEGLLPDVEDQGQSYVRNAIRHERRVELGFEFQRYFDIIRYGANYANNAFNDKENFDYNTNKFFPIPQKEVDTNFEL